MRIAIAIVFAALTFHAQAAVVKVQENFATTNLPPTLTNIILSLSSNAVSLATSNAVWVSQGGSDSTGVRGNLAKPFLTLAYAKTNALAGDTVFVLPGYYTTAVTLLKSNVNWHFFNGAVVTNSNGNVAMFDDTPGAMGDVRVTGNGDFWCRNTSGSPFGVIWIQNATTLDFRGKALTGGSPTVEVDGYSASLTLSDAVVSTALGGTVSFSQGSSTRFRNCQILNTQANILGWGVRYWTSDATNTTYENCSVFSGSGSNSIGSEVGISVFINVEGILTVNTNIGPRIALTNRVGQLLYSLSASNIVGRLFTGNAAGLTNFTLPSNLATNNGDNNFSTGQTVNGILVVPSAIRTTNTATGNWTRTTNGIMTLGPTNTPTANITLTGSSGAGVFAGAVTAGGTGFIGQYYNDGAGGSKAYADTGLTQQGFIFNTRVANTIPLLAAGVSGQTADLIQALAVSGGSILWRVGATGDCFGLTFRGTNGYWMPSNALATWPTAPRAPGDAFWGNSNGTVYLLQSALGATWTSTNKIGQ